MDHPSILYSQLKEHVQKFGYSSLTKDERMFIRKYNDRHSVLGTQKVKTRKTKVRKQKGVKTFFDPSVVDWKAPAIDTTYKTIDSFQAVMMLPDVYAV